MPAQPSHRLMRELSWQKSWGCRQEVYRFGSSLLLSIVLRCPDGQVLFVFFRFQNKRQSMRQSNRQSSTHIPPTTTEPFVAAAQSSTLAGAVMPPGGTYHGSSPTNPMPSISMASQGYSQRPNDPYARVGPSPTPSHSRARSREDDRSSRRSPGRHY